MCLSRVLLLDPCVAGQFLPKMLFGISAGCFVSYAVSPASCKKQGAYPGPGVFLLVIGGACGLAGLVTGAGSLALTLMGDETATAVLSTVGFLVSASVLLRPAVLKPCLC